MSSLFSDRWHLVASLRPTLSARAVVRRQRVRGSTWIVLQVEGGPALRLNASAWAIAGGLSAAATVGELWDAALAHSDDAPTQEEVIDLLARLREASLVAFDQPGDAARAVALLQRARAVQQAGHAIGPLSWRVRLGDPSRMLAPLRPLANVLFSRAGAAVVAGCIFLLALLAVLRAPQLVAHGREWMTTPRYLALALVLYVPTKALHELAHALAVLRFGGRVRAAGVTFMLLVPAPWVDASAAAAFADRRQRVLVGAAGILCELVLAGVALALWCWLDNGLMRDAAFVTLAISGASALVFNANPLQRLDGYFIATDLLGLPNLAARSRAWWSHFLRHRLLGDDAHAFPAESGERPWLVAYAPAAWLFGMAIAFCGVRWLGASSTTLGLAAAVVMGWQAMLAPALRLGRELGGTAAHRSHSSRRWRCARWVTAATVAGVLALPVPQQRTVPGVVWPGDKAFLRAGEDGFVETVAALPSGPVHAGDVVLRLSNPALETRLAKVSANVAALESTLMGAVDEETGDAARRGSAGAGSAADARSELAAAQAERAQVQARVDALTLRAGQDGRLAFATRDDLGGRFFRRGALVGQVLSGEPPRVRIAWPQAVPLPSDGEGQVQVLLAGSRNTAWPARLARAEAGGAQGQLPSAALSQRHGGPIVTDPTDASDLRPLQPVVVLEVQLRDGAAAGRTGERCWVRFADGVRPWGWTLLQAARRIVIQQFSPRS